jgi:hypothetical protein
MMLYWVVLLLQATHNKISFIFENWLSVVIISFWLVVLPVILIGAMVWIRKSQRNIINQLKTMVTRKEFDEAFILFRKEIETEK